MYKFSLILIIGLLFLSFQISVSAADGDADPYFLTGYGFNDEVLDIALQQDGKLIVVGEFTSVVGAPRKYIARLKSNGNHDESFNPGESTNGIIRLVKILPNGKILIAGSFTSFDGNPAKNIALLNSDGSLDNSFNTGTGPSDHIFTTVVQSDGKILVGGNFDSFSGLPRKAIVRLNPNGTVDSTFSLAGSITTSTVAAIAVQTNGKIIIGGSFSLFNGSSRDIARLEQNGSLDTTFLIGAGANSGVTSIVIQPDEKILVGGPFNEFNGTNHRKFTRLLSNGSPDTTFNPATNNQILTFKRITLQTDGKIILTGTFSFPESSSNKVMRLNSDGSSDISFTGFENQEVNTITTDSDNKIILGGKFTAPANFGGASPAGVRRLNNDGSRDASYITRSGAAGGSESISIQSDGKIVTLGSIVVGGFERFGLARLNTDGTVDESYNPNVRGRVFVIQPDNKVVVGGVTTTGNIYRFYRFNQDGSFDPTFVADSGTQGTGIHGEANVHDMVVQPDGKIVAVGTFELVNGIVRKGMVRLNTDGTVDASFNANLQYQPGEGQITKVRLQPDGKMVVVSRGYSLGNWKTSIFRFNANGTFDGTFGQTAVDGTDPFIRDLAIQFDGKIVLGGVFNQVNSYAIKNLARLNSNGSIDVSFVPVIYSGLPINYVYAVFPQKDGKVLVSGSFTNAPSTSLNGFARLNYDGSFDPSFRHSTMTVFTIARESDGNLIVGGSLNSIHGLLRSGIARVFNSVKSSSFADFDGDGKSDVSVFRPSNGVWYLQQSTAAFNGVAFGANGDLIAPADYDGDGKTDIAVFRPSNGVWYLNRSQLGFTGVAFGANGDVPLPADYDGDGKADLAVFRPSNGVWYIQQSTAGFTGIAFGANGDVPVAADYDGDGKTDIAVFRPSNGVWYLQRSQLGFTGVAFGANGDKPTPADYDGDRKADLAVFRPSNGVWYLQQSTAGFTGIAFGANGDLLVPADYDGDGKADLSVFRPSNGVWYLNRSTQGFTGIAFGVEGDKPVSNAFIQ